MEIVFVGAGRLATQLAKALYAKGHVIRAVYSRTLASAQTLADAVGADATNSISGLPRQADVFIVAVADAALPQVADALLQGRSQATVLHTAGSMPMQVLQGFAHHGVLYPMQTFSKERPVDFAQVPFFIEGNGQHALQVARQLSSSLSESIYELSSEERRYLHLAAVFACNFSNHCYALAAHILQQHGLPFSVMLPLIDETTQKVHELEPRQAQTGPAVRYDENVMAAHMQLLSQEPRMQQVYALMSQSIHEIST